MTTPHDDPDGDALREVGAAYRELPPPSPDAALDARVRAAVAAELGTPAGGASARSGQVIAFPRSPRALRGFALAATVLAAVGIGYSLQDREVVPALAKRDVAPLERRPSERELDESGLRQLATGPSSTAVPMSAPAPRSAPVPVAAPAPAPAPAIAPMPAAVEPQTTGASSAAAGAEGERSRADARERAADSLNVVASRASADVVAAPPPPPLPAALFKAEPPAPAPVPARASADQNRQAESAASAIAAGALPRTAAKLAKPAPPDPDAATFESIRRLLGEQRIVEAREQLRRWHDEHRDHAVPSDLQPLLADPPR